MAGINVPIGAAIVEYGEDPDKVVFDITVGGIVFNASTTTQDVTVDQYGDTVVKQIVRGATAQVTVPFAENDLKRLAAAMPNGEYVEDATDPTKKKIIVKTNVGMNLLESAKKLVIKPKDPYATPNDYITIPLAVATTNPELTFNNDNERVYNLTFTAVPDTENDGVLYILGDETATA